jgi:5-methylcytosine-specific restriction endonuclease McrA
MSLPRGRKQIISLYGNVALVRGRCPDCRNVAIIRDGKFLCCDRVVNPKPTSVKREVEPEQRRRRPGVAEREEILASQDYRCIYCEKAFGSMIYRNDKPLILKVHWDHDIPYAYSQNNHAWNFVAACQVCNLLKSDFIFRDLEDAQLFLRMKRQEKGYDF